jgi:hypothetical protein
MLGGTVDPDVGMRAIAYGEGWPMQTRGGFLFATPHNGRESMSISGDLTGLRPVAMKKEGGLFWANLPARGEGAGRYKFVDSSGEYSADPWSRRYGYDDNGEFSLTHAKGAHLERWPLFGDRDFAPRTLRVFVPAEAPTHHLYVHDGQNLFGAPGAHNKWHIDKSVGPRTLVIGIDTVERFDELTFTKDRVKEGGPLVGGRGEEYAQFIGREVQRMIEREYGRPRRIGVMGSSLGGEESFTQALERPGSYNFVGSMSGTFGWGKPDGKGETLIDRYRNIEPDGTVFYLDSGGGPGRDNYDSTLEMRDMLASRGAKFGQDLFHWHEPDAPHNEAAWGARVFRPIKIFESL